MGYLEGKKGIITSMWSKIDATNDEIIEGVTTEYEVTVGPEFKPTFEVMGKEFEEAFNQFDAIMVLIHTNLNNLTKQEKIQVQPLQLPENLVLNTNNRTNLKLKPIDIPSFAGDYRKWISLIHDNREFSNLQKIH